jgi:hypothetical protein
MIPHSDGSMRSISDEADELLSGIMTMGAFSKLNAIPSASLRKSMDIDSKGKFDEQISELMRLGLVSKLLPSRPHDTIKYFADIGNIAEFCGVDEAEVQADFSSQEVPAADRIVSLNHNQPQYLEVQQGLAEIRKSVRELNDLPVEAAERDRIISGLAAAETLWSGTQLKVLQIKVGVLMIVEDAAKALISTAKAVTAALLVDTIKAFVKTNIGIDLDRL